MKDTLLCRCDFYHVQSANKIREFICQFPKHLRKYIWERRIPVPDADYSTYEFYTNSKRVLKYYNNKIL